MLPETELIHEDELIPEHELTVVEYAPFASSTKIKILDGLNVLFSCLLFTGCISGALVSLMFLNMYGTTEPKYAIFFFRRYSAKAFPAMMMSAGIFGMFTAAVSAVLTAFFVVKYYKRQQGIPIDEAFIGEDGMGPEGEPLGPEMLGPETDMTYEYTDLTDPHTADYTYGYTEDTAH